MKFLDIGFNSYITTEKILAIIPYEGAPTKRQVRTAREENKVTDSTFGRRTLSVIVTTDNQLILSALDPETLAEGVTKK